MSTPPSPRQETPPSAAPVPHPTHPVARCSVTADAPTFDWTRVPNADTYRLQLAASDAFETLYYDATVDGPISLSLDDVLPNDATEGVWRVRVEAPDVAPWSTAACFEVSASDETGDDRQFLVDASPVPVHPIKGDAVEAHAAAFTWEPVPEASGYRLQVDTDEAFDDAFVNLRFDQTASLTLFDVLPAKRSPLYWRVRALFPNDTEGPWSETAVFGTDPEATSEETVASEGEEPASPHDPVPVEESPIAAGPAREAHTSQTMAVTFIAVLLVSFVATILLIMLYL